MYTNAQWVDQNRQHISIRCDISGVTSFVPIAPDNTDYKNIMALVEKGQLTIAPAEDKE
jgi:hypothetical protein